MPPHSHDFFVAGRWRDHRNVRVIVDTLRAHGRTVYSFVDCAYEDPDVAALLTGDPEHFMTASEQLAQDDPRIRRIFDRDMSAERAAASFLLVLPAGIAGHIEAGVAYGLGKPCYALGAVEKTETLYCVFERIFPDLAALDRWLRAAQELGPRDGS